MQDLSNYEKIRQDALTYYNKLGKVHCPALNDLVYFNSGGFNHLIYKGDRREREKSVQMMKFKLLPAAHELIQKTTTYQEYEETLKEVEVKRHKKRVREIKPVKYWGLIAIMRNKKIKVIVRQIGDGQKHFLSVIPNWVTNSYRDTKFISTMKGDPEEEQ